VKLEVAHLDLFLGHRLALIDYAAPIVGCRASAEDVVQEAHIRFSAAMGRADAAEDRIAQPVSYLYRVVRNLALDWSRRLKVETSLPEADSVDSIPVASPTPEREVLYRAELRVVAEALAELPERTRIAFEMHRLGDHPLRQVAARLGMSIGLGPIDIQDSRGSISVIRRSPAFCWLEAIDGEAIRAEPGAMAADFRAGAWQGRRSRAER